MVSKSDGVVHHFITTWGGDSFDDHYCYCLKARTRISLKVERYDKFASGQALETLNELLFNYACNFRQSHQELESKKHHVQELSSELETLRSKLSEPAPARLLDTTQDEAESADEMRANIVSLAQALEKSETRRADVIERIEKERQANADSLRRMTDSVKRFYSTLNK